VPGRILFVINCALLRLIHKTIYAHGELFNNFLNYLQTCVHVLAGGYEMLLFPFIHAAIMFSYPATLFCFSGNHNVD
jgi:hypothetical protein